MTPRRAKKGAGHPVGELRERWGRDSIHLFGAVGSTNDVAKRLADEEDAPAGSVVLAREQERGRGRGTKSWASPEGGLYLSMIFRPGRVGNPGLLPLLAGVGIVRELDRTFEGLAPALKWPNDVMVEDRKAGGVLCEAASEDGEVRHLVVGVGLNVEPLPSDLEPEVLERAISLREALGEEVELLRVADAVVEGLEAFVPGVPERLGPRMLELLDEYDWLRDRRVGMELPDEKDERPVPGVCVGIAPDGALLFRPDRGALRRLHGGVVHPELGSAEAREG